MQFALHIAIRNNEYLAGRVSGSEKGVEIPMETYRVLVTGCSGFLGPYVMDEFAGAGYEVMGFDLLEPGFPIASFFRGDFTDRRDLKRALTGITAVCHLGGIGDVYLAEKDAALAFRANAFGTKTITDACVELGMEKLIYASSWEVYGKPIKNPVDEGHPCNPETPYSISKLAGELFVRAAEGRNGLKTLALRLGTAYGPSMRESAVISRFLRQSKAGAPLTVHGDGSQFRQFTYAADIGRAFVAALSHSPRGRVYNIASDEAVRMIDLARLISKQVGGSIEFQPARHSEPASARMSSARALRDLKWQQTVRFEDGLHQLMASFDATGTTDL